jgi:hypothetical protein
LQKAKMILAGTGALALGCSVWVTVFSTSAQSESAPQVSLTQSTWFWQAEVAAGQGIALPGSPAPTVPDPTVPSGDLAVSGPEEQGNAPKETYLEFDVSAIPPGSTITSFKISLPVDSSAQNLVPAGTVPAIVACAPQVTWSGDPGPQPPNQKPTDHCDATAPKVTSTDNGKTYRVDVASIATGWVSPGGQNFGVAITNDPSNATTAYQVVFGPPSAISTLQATVIYVPPASDNSLGGAAGGLPASGNASTPSALSGSAAPSAAASAALVPISPTAGSPPETAAVPQAAPTTAGIPARIRPTRFAAATSAPPVGFWVAGVLLAALIAVCMLELRLPPEAPLGSSERGVGRLLSRLAAGEEGASLGGGGTEVRSP